MQFEFHKAIWFFWIIPVLFIVFLLVEKKRRAILFRFVRWQNLRTKLPEFSPMAAWIQFVFFLLALFFFGIALLKPYEGFEMHEVTRKGVDLFFLVDVSPSMLAQDIKPSRLERAKYELKDFLKMLTGDRVGLIGFSGESFVLVPLTGDYEAFKIFLDELSPDLISVTGTDINGALQKAISTYKQEGQSSSKAIILITDGEDSVGLSDDVITDIKNGGIKVFVIGVGTPEGAPMPMSGGGYKKDQSGAVVLSRLNEQVLQDLALETGGGYVRSVSGDLDLKQIYNDGIKKAFAAADLTKTEKKIPHYHFQGAILAGLICLFLESLKTNRKNFLSRAYRKKFPLAIFLVFTLLASPVFAKNPFVFGQATEDFASGDYSAALKKFLDLKNSDPNDPDVNYNLGETYYRLSQFPDAEKSYRQALNHPDKRIREQALYNLGNTLYRENKLEDALSFYENALKIDGKDEGARLNAEFVKKKLQEQKQKEEQKSQDQKDQEQKQDQDNDKKDQEQKNQNQSDQNKQDADKNQEDEKQNQSGSKNDEDKSDQQKKPDGEDQKKSEEKDKTPGSSDSGAKQDQNQQKQDEQQDQEQNDSAKDDADKSQSESQQNPQGDLPQTGTAEVQQGKEDTNAHQWLDSVSDDPGQALKYLIDKKSLNKNKRFDKDW